jgi:hypothetical protein
MSSLGSLAIINFKTIAIKKGGIRPLRTQLASAEDVLPMRTRHREEMNCQIVHDSIHRRPGWTLTYRLAGC